MKVVLFCGEQGMKPRNYSGKVPKPMIPIGQRPVLWHVMKYYAHFGHKDFILCLGHQGEIIKDYFVKGNDYISNDFILKGGSKVNLLSQDIDNWRITFVDTGINSNPAERLLAIKKYVVGEEMFLVNYTDGLTDLDLNDMLKSFNKEKMVGMLMASKPARSLHVTSINSKNTITNMTALNKMEHVWINSGYFIFTQEIFNHIDPSDDLPEKTFPHLVKKGLLAAYPYKGMFLTMDTFKEKQTLDDMHAAGNTPWQVWKEKAPLHNSRNKRFDGSGLACFLKAAFLHLELLPL